MHETDINVLILSNVNIVNQVDHSASSEFLDICVFSELLKPALLLCQPTHHAVSLTGEPHNGVACLLDLLVELSCEGFVFLTADKIALEVFISTGFQSATFSSVSAQWLPSILKSFGERYPNIEFEVLTGDYYGQSEDWILQGKVDCGFLRLPSVKRLQTYPLHRDELQVILPCNHPLAGSAPFPAAALATEPFIRLEEGQDYEITAALDKMGIRPNIKYTVREDRTMLAMVSKGLGISLLPELMVRHSPYPVTACHAPERFYRSIGIGVKDKKAMSAATRRFVDYVRQWVAENGDK